METLTAKNFRFSDFELDGVRRVLLKDGEPVALNPKAFDLLLTLVGSRGELLSKDDLLESVWPGQFVEEGNLKVHISTLRKALNEGKNEHRFIVTVPGRGYSFVAELEDTNGDIVVESHSLSRIVISEETTDLETRDPSGVRQSTRSFTRRKPNYYLISAIAGAIVCSALAAGYLFLRRSSDQPAPGMAFEDLKIKRLTTNGKVSFAALSPDGKLFAYALKELEQNSLWLGFVNGGEDITLRPSETGRYNDLAFSADGNSILFTFSGAESRESILYRMPASGGPREKIRERIASFSVAPDGKRFAFVGPDPGTKSNNLIVASFDGGGDSVIALPATRSLSTESISWSSNGNEIAIGATPAVGDPHDEVFIANVADGSVRQATAHGWKEVIKTAWIDGGNALLLVAQEKDSNTSVSYSQIWHVALPGGEPRQLTRDLSSYRSVLNASSNGFLTVELRQMNNIWVAPYEDLSQAKQVTFGTFGKYDGLLGVDWTADGKIVFASTDHQSQVISEMDPDGSNVKQLTPPGSNDSMVNASSDGKYIVFESTRAGGSDIWRMDADGGNILRLTHDGSSYHPFVSPDGQFVYYITSRASGGGLFRISINGGGPEKISDQVVSNPSISADGTQVAAALGSSIAIFPIRGGTPTKQFELTRFGTPSGNTRWSPDGRSIAYRDRGYGYWLQPVDGSEPQRMKGLPKEKFYNFAWSKNGEQFAFVRGQEIRDVVLFRHTQ